MKIFLRVNTSQMRFFIQKNLGRGNLPNAPEPNGSYWYKYGASHQQRIDVGWDGWVAYAKPQTDRTIHWKHNKQTLSKNADRTIRHTLHENFLNFLSHRRPKRKADVLREVRGRIIATLVKHVPPSHRSKRSNVTRHEGNI